MIHAFERATRGIMRLFGRSYISVRPDESALIFRSESGDQVRVITRYGDGNTLEGVYARTAADISASLWLHDHLSDARKLAQDRYCEVIDARSQAAIQDGETSVSTD